MSDSSNQIGWLTKPLIEVATLQRGYDLPVQDRTDGPYPIFAANGPVGFHGAAKCKGPGVVTGRSGTIGKVHFVQEDYWPLNTSLYVTEFHGNDPKWVYYMLKTFGLERYSQGAGVPTLNRNLIHGESVSVPPLHQQRRIAAILDQADALRAKRREALALLDELERGIFIEMFGDPADNPMDWPLRRLDSICDVGSSKRVFVEELEERGVPFYRGTEIGQLGDGEAVTPSLFISREHYERLNAEAGVPRKGDLLLPSICPDGRIYVVDTDEPFYFKDARVLWIKVDQSVVNSLFLRHYLKLLFAKNYSQVASGTTFAELKIFALKGLDIQSPPIEMQRRFASLARSVETQRESVKSSYGELNKLFESLQHRAFRGEL